MQKLRWRGVFWALGLGAALGSASQAKPPDLPASNDVRCPHECESRENGRLLLGWDAISGKVRLEVEPSSPSEPEALPLWLDVWCPNVMPYLVQRLCERLMSITAQNAGVAEQVDEDPPSRDPSAKNVRRQGPSGEPNSWPESATSAQEARRLYELADRFVRDGKVEKARALLRQAHMVNPICHFGRLAIDRLQELETPSEEPSEPAPPTTQEPPQPDQPSSKPDAADTERAFRRMRERTVPLGMVEIQTY
jgi:hypothetical protein